jgi:preprotein translocase subunit SecA
MSQRGISHEVLNAKQHFREAEIVAQAGRPGAVTVATNMAGRGVDILLGGNPGGLALRQVQAEGLDLHSEEGHARLALLEAQFAKECEEQGETVRQAGGLYVVGSERHESRRIDNQLRGRSGRQGEPGESRFFLSLEDDLLRLFASGAISWVMDRALPEDVPIEAKMVTKAIERAQNTVEGRNAETRKEVLKYDEVMNQQRKVIYQRRIDVINGDDLHDPTVELLVGAITNVVVLCCPTDYPEEWDLNQLVAELTQYYPTKFSVADLSQASTQDQLIESIETEALAFYEERSATFPGGEEAARSLERDIMLQIIDQRWQEHLSEMDYLREGINLRAMGQQDPLVAWQQEGFSMFGKMMETIDDDYLRYLFHVETVAQEVQPSFDQATYVAAEDPVDDFTFAQATLASQQGVGTVVAPEQIDPAELEAFIPVVKDDAQKTGRNEPCWCGSGKKYKFCHGAA